MYSNNREIRQCNPDVLRKTGLFLVFMALIIASAGASSPPVQPILSFHIVPGSGSLDSVFTLSATWDAVVAYNRAPDQIKVDVYAVNGAQHTGGISLEPVNGACSRTSCIYAASVPGRLLFTGQLKLIATDPESGVTDSKTLMVDPGRGYTAGEPPATPPSLFGPVSVIIGLVLICILALVIRTKTP